MAGRGDPVRRAPTVRFAVVRAEIIVFNVALIAFGFIGSLITIVSGIVQFMARKGRAMSYEVEDRRLFNHEKGSLPQAFRMTYGTRPVERLTRSIIYVWNSGSETVRQNDVVGHKPIAFRIANPADILDVSIARQNRDDFTCEFLPHPAHGHSLKFSFLDPDDGVAIEVLHTGGKLDVSCHGMIIGAAKWWKKQQNRKCRRIRTAFPIANRHFRLVIKHKLLISISLGVGVLYMLLGALILWPLTGCVPKSVEQSFGSSDINTALGVLAIGVVLTAASGLSLHRARWRHPRLIDVPEVID